MVGTRMGIAKREAARTQRDVTSPSGGWHVKVVVDATRSTGGALECGGVGESTGEIHRGHSTEGRSRSSKPAPLIESKRGTKRELPKCKLDGQNANAPSTFFGLMFLLPAATCGFPSPHDRRHSRPARLEDFDRGFFLAARPGPSSHRPCAPRRASAANGNGTPGAPEPNLGPTTARPSATRTGLTACWASLGSSYRPSTARGGTTPSGGCETRSGPPLRRAMSWNPKKPMVSSTGTPEIHCPRTDCVSVVVPYLSNPDFVKRPELFEGLKTALGYGSNPTDSTSQSRVSVFWIHACTAERFQQAYTSFAQQLLLADGENPGQPRRGAGHRVRAAWEGSRNPTRRHADMENLF